MNLNIDKIILISLLIIAPSLTHYLPTFRIVEDPNYGATLKKAIKEMEKVEFNQNGFVYVTAQLAMPIIVHEKTRLFFHYFKTLYGHELVFDKYDRLYYDNPDDIQHIYENTNLNKDGS